MSGNWASAAVQLRRRLRDVQIGNDAAAPAILREFQRTPVGFDRVGDQLVFVVQRAEAEIIVGDFGGHIQPGGFQIIGAGGGPRVGGLRLPAHAAPQIQFPAEINRRGEGVVSVGCAGGLALFGVH